MKNINSKLLRYLSRGISSFTCHKLEKRYYISYLYNEFWYFLTKTLINVIQKQKALFMPLFCFYSKMNVCDDRDKGFSSFVAYQICRIVGGNMFLYISCLANNKRLFQRKVKYCKYFAYFIQFNQIRIKQIQIPTK